MCRIIGSICAAYVAKRRSMSATNAAPWREARSVPSRCHRKFPAASRWSKRTYRVDFSRNEMPTRASSSVCAATFEARSTATCAAPSCATESSP